MNVLAAVAGNSAIHSRKSEYKHSWEANIAKNKQLFQELVEKFRWGNEENDARKKKKEKKKKKDEKKPMQGTRSSARLR